MASHLLTITQRERIVCSPANGPDSIPEGFEALPNKERASVSFKVKGEGKPIYVGYALHDGYTVVMIGQARNVFTRTDKQWQLINIVHKQRALTEEIAKRTVYNYLENYSYEEFAEIVTSVLIDFSRKGIVKI